MRTDSTRIIEEFSGDTLVTRELLRAITQRIVEAVHPDKIILFGSYAYGEPTLDSDIDLLVIMRSRKRAIERTQMISDLFPRRYFGMDIFVRTPAEVRTQLTLGNYFIQEIVQKGKVLYERQDHHSTRLGRQSRNGLSSRPRTHALEKKPSA